MVSLELKDIQGNILRGYGSPYAVHLFYSIPSPMAGRAFLAELVGKGRSAEEWKVRPPAMLNVAVTFAGLEQLAVGETTLSQLPNAFRQPMARRAEEILEDTGPSAPEHWTHDLGREKWHLLVMVAASSV